MKSSVGSYIINGVTKTPTYAPVVSAAATTKHGVTADDGTGTYRGADLWEAITAGQLASGISKLQDGTTVVGTLDNVTNVVKNANLVGQSNSAILVSE